MPGIDHADHNAKVCELLLKEGNFSDWVVTTAYYSAIYYIDAKLFPLTVGSEPQFATFNQYLSRRRASGQGGKPHEIRLELVRQNLSSCYSQLKWLFDTCDGARYNSYKVSPEIAKHAKTKLDEIRSNCSNKK